MVLVRKGTIIYKSLIELSEFPVLGPKVSFFFISFKLFAILNG